MTDERNSDVTPESLMDNFKGPKLVALAILTVVVHVLLIFGSSLPYLKDELLGADSSKMTKDDRIKLAVEEATIELREIAEKYELNPQEISDQFASGGSRTKKASEPDNDEAKGPADAPDDKPEAEPREKSAIEKKIEEKKEGPKVPTFEDKKDDIF